MCNLSLRRTLLTVGKQYLHQILCLCTDYPHDLARTIGSPTLDLPQQIQWIHQAQHCRGSEATTHQGSGKAIGANVLSRPVQVRNLSHARTQIFIKHVSFQATTIQFQPVKGPVTGSQIPRIRKGSGNLVDGGIHLARTCQRF